MKTCSFLSLLPVVALAAALPAQTLLVTNQYAHTLSFVDPATAKVVAEVAEGGAGHEVIASPDGRWAVVPLYGSAGVGKPGTDGSTMLIVDVPAHKVVKTFDFGHGVRPHKPVWDAKRNVLYVTTELDKTVSVLDPKTWTIVGSIPTEQEQSHMFALSHDGMRGYTANVGPGTVSVLDIADRKTLKVIPISKDTQRISISNDDKWVFTADQVEPKLAVIDAKTMALKSWVTLPGIGYGTAPTKDGKYLIVTLRPSHEVAIVDLASLKVVKTIPLEEIPTEVIVRPDGKVAYVSCGHRVAALDTSTWAVQNWIATGNGADGLAWAK
ncbi:YncE family protein [Terriglobus saanensis]|uniref:40-residue YVTN family beta-propeller repeat protein n=1 Tax=Terriglobus saanensis (strain ATCC BAA-1853 / DSM 23119 / SP1PR4) TaxID=401053 RepID=E8UZZ8_TERSS|nr:cytochrome D1 domain-containing protein [Terriglobus saanensis]ADV82153.1 hypothetical protein AciPR4_1329 [Terriglobus saanensis SP1PR4]